MASIENVDHEILFENLTLHQFCYCVTNRKEHLNSADRTLVNIQFILYLRLSMEKQHQGKCYMLPTHTQQITDSRPTVHRLLACV